MRGLVGLARRQATAYRTVPVAFALLVLLVAGVVTAWPRLLADVDDRQTGYELAGASAASRDVVAVLPGQWPALTPAEPGTTPFEPAVEENLGDIEAALQDLRAAQPQPLRGLLGEPRFWVQTARFLVEPPPDPLMGTQWLTLKVDPWLTDHVELVDGDWPRPPAVVHPHEGLSDEERAALTLDENIELRRAAIDATGPFEVVLAASAAEALEWEIGTERRIEGETVPLLLTGVFEATDAQDEVWEHHPASAEPAVVDDLNLGTSAQAAAYMNPQWDGQLPAPLPSPGFTTQLWYPVAVDALTAQDVPAAAAQLTGFSPPQPLGSLAPQPPDRAPEQPPGAGDGSLDGPEVRFDSGLSEVFERLEQQQAVTQAVLAVVAAGPLGVTVAVFLLAARLLVTRRRASLALLAARGASGYQLRSMLALEGLVLALPAAALGALLAIATLPGRTAPGDLLLTGLVGLTPAVMLAASASPGGLRKSRADLGRSHGRWRLTAEVALLGITAVALVLLRQRGVSPGAGETDLLLSAVPLLLAVATCVLVLRLYPLPVRALQRVLRRHRRLTSSLGAARAVRDPAGGLVPAVALVVGVSVTMFSVVLSGTISSGVQAAAWQTVGADLRLSGPVFDEEQTAEIAGVPGVAGVAAVADAGTVQIGSERLSLAAVDPGAVRGVQAGATGIDELPAELGSADPGDGTVPAVLSDVALDALAASTGDRLRVGVAGGVQIEVVATTGQLAGAGQTGDVLVDADAFAAATGRDVRPRVLLVDVADGAEPTAVLDRIRDVEPVALAQQPAGDASSVLSSPMAGGMSAALTVAVVLSLVLVAVAVVMTQLMGAPARARLLAVLRTLGLERRQARGIVAWELAPLAVVAVLAGGALGVLVPWVMLGAMDLTALTGGQHQPALEVDPLAVGGVIGGVLLVTALAVAVSTTMSSRADLAAELRTGEE